MKRRSQWFIAFLTLFGLAVPSFLTCSDANATLYRVNTIPLYNDVFTNFNPSTLQGDTYTLGEDLVFSFDSRFDPSLKSTLQDGTRFSTCDNSAISDLNRNIFNSIGGNGVVNIRSTSFFLKSDINYNNSCRLDSSGNRKATSWAFDSFYTSAFRWTSDDASSFLDVPSAFLNSNSPTVTEGGALVGANIPFRYTNKFNHIEAGTPLSFRIDFVLPVDADKNFYGGSNIRSDITPTMSFQYFTTPVTMNPSDSVNFVNTALDGTNNPAVCTTITDFPSFVWDASTGWTYFKGVRITCDWTPSTDIYYLHANLNISGTTQRPFILFDNHHFYIGDSSLVTNNDETFSEEFASPQPSGDNIDLSPGYTQFYDTDSHVCADGDWFCQFISLFSFNFINPFTPIFGLFANNESCTQIPTISGMIHSDEQTVCPWFDSSTRNIVTPVLGIASLMLLFGFAVRWLGARSGNFFEDTTEGNDVGSIHIGRRNKK